jgi:hypothetical protein
MSAASAKQTAALRPKDEASLKEFHRVIGTALRVMIHDTLPDVSEVVIQRLSNSVLEKDGLRWNRFLLGRKGQHERIPTVMLQGNEFDGTVVVWIHPSGKSSLIQDGMLVPAARAILDKKAAILAPDVLLTGESADAKAAPVNKDFAGYTFGYNRPLLANRVHDILTAVAFARGREKTVHLVGFDKAGPWVVLARALGGDAVSRTAADVDQFRFDKVASTSDEMLLPGALKYGGLPAFAALCAPGELYLHNHEATGIGEWAKAAYEAAGSKGRLERSPDKVAPEKVAAWLVR